MRTTEKVWNDRGSRKLATLAGFFKNGTRFGHLATIGGPLFMNEKRFGTIVTTVDSLATSAGFVQERKKVWNTNRGLVRVICG